MGRVRIEEGGERVEFVWYPSFPVGVEADEVVDGRDGVEEREVDAHEHQQPRHRARSVRHLGQGGRRPGRARRGSEVGTGGG